MTRPPDLVAHLDRMFESKIKPRVARTLHASAIGHPCARCLVYSQCFAGRKHDVSLQRIFEMGNMMETQAQIDIMQSLKGTEITLENSQDYLPENRWNIAGRIDWWIKVTDELGVRWKYPCEFKSTSPYAFQSITCAGDIVTHKNLWVRKWLAQLSIYMLMRNVEQGILLLRNKVTGEYKQVDVPLDMEYCEGLLKRAESVLESVVRYKASNDDNDLPERVQFDPDLCDECDYRDRCIPDIRQAGQIDIQLGNVELEGWIKVMEEAEPVLEQVKTADEKIKAHLAGLCAGLAPGQKRTSITDHYYVTGTVTEATRNGKTSTYVRKSIKKIGESEQ